jgi:hypothetical protein
LDSKFFRRTNLLTQITVVIIFLHKVL